jgi:hypothetical protein
MSLLHSKGLMPGIAFTDPCGRLRLGKAQRGVMRIELGIEAHDALVSHAATAAADGQQGSVEAAAMIAASRGRNEVLPELLLSLDGNPLWLVARAT